jgi:hypothetical protein
VVLGSKDRGSLRRIGGGLVLAGVVTLGAWGGAARGDTIIFDNFDNAGTGDLNNRVPTVSNGNAWHAPTMPSTNLKGNGSGGVSAITTVSNTASIKLGTGYLSSHPGVYDLSLDMTQATGGSSSSDLSWVAVGFMRETNTANNMVSNKGEPWVLYRYNGVVSVYAGPGIDTTDSPAGTPAPLYSTNYQTGVSHNFKLELDTTQLKWTLNAYVDGTQLDLNGVTTPGSTFTYKTNPISDYVGMGTGMNQNGGIATVDNFQFVKVTPLPSAAGMAVVGFAGLLVGRRRGK